MLNSYSLPTVLLAAALIGGNVLPPIAAAAAATPPPPTNVCVNGQCASKLTAGGIKWHPGHYVWLDPHSTQAAQFAAIDELSNETAVQGIQLLANWSSLEGSTPGDYSNGFALVDAFLAKLGSEKVPKRLILGVVERKYGATPAAGTSCAVAAHGLLPDYLASTANGGCAIEPPGAAGNLAVTARFWEPAVMDRLIALSQAYAKRYDSNPLFEMFVGNGETSVGAPADSGFSTAAYLTQLERWFDASEKAWPHTQLRLAANYFGSDAQMSALMAYASANGGVIVGGPDPELPLPTVTRTVQSNELFRAAQGTGTDMRGTIPWIGEVQQMGLGTKFTQTPADIFNYYSNVMHASYMVWLRNGWVGGPPQMWSTGILPYIQSINGKVYSSACPAIYQQGCNTN